MNLITADFNWISFALVIIAGIIGMIKSNTRKSECPSASLAPESCEEEEKSVSRVLEACRAESRAHMAALEVNTI